MALTNDQITAQNFKDFYGQIRPYLNGNVPTFANTFSKSDLYSTDEVLIGRWIDGKPLYQKVITGTLPNCTTEGTVVSKNDQHNIPNVDLIFIDHAFVKDFSDWPATSTLTRILPYTLNAGSQMKVSIGRTVVQYANAAKTYNGSTVYSVARYTKLTDSSMSVTDGNEYSLDEQVVGHWVNGKPLYQKTIIIPNCSPNTWNTTAHNISNVDDVVEETAMVRCTNGTIYCIGYRTTEVCGMIQATATTVGCYLGTHTVYNGAVVTITIKYTKTTD